MTTHHPRNRLIRPDPNGDTSYRGWTWVNTSDDATYVYDDQGDWVAQTVPAGSRGEGKRHQHAEVMSTRVDGSR